MNWIHGTKDIKEIDIKRSCLKNFLLSSSVYKFNIFCSSKNLTTTSLANTNSLCVNFTNNIPQKG